MKRGMRFGSRMSGILGIVGCIVCMGSMILAAIGVAGAVVSGSMSAMSMSGMGMNSMSGSSPGWLETILKFGPVILVVSVLLVTVSIGIRRRRFIIPALVGGVIMYLGMYMTINIPLMVISTVVGFVLWGVLYVKSMPRNMKSGVATRV
ncbi:hypothetical protein [Ferroacidibacillus organovorans]|uniref:Uncharacterized protein n=1 Tax=Ferroacidibacillus organovorans TaxID=1765683 RepID=A0A853KCQ0_9BACL|nr:hypothetical protein [Ferroacidibacillus organovorans]KYP79929.1 hypothetical protein AYJ22_03255 [Ferroacidibacillus organovorans]OAG94593.1 hypothetical protein AYW79_04360 [Ferroacidibacillus organovorans]